MNNNDYSSLVNALKGKSIAIVYTFENEDALGFAHYHVWESRIISGWLNAVQEIKCLPFVIDVRTFVQKVINNTLPCIDFVLNLNCGCYNLSTACLVPSVCSFAAIPCIPCNAVSIITSENKKISNHLATVMRLNVPKKLDYSCKGGIYKPVNLGSSIGVGRDDIPDVDGEIIYQEFIPGYDITIPIVFNPYINDIDLLPPIIYMPKSYDPEWIYSESEKKNDNGFEIFTLEAVEAIAKTELINFAKEFPIETFGRIDARLYSSENMLTTRVLDDVLRLRNLYFIEMNSMPTIENDDSFEYAFNAASATNDHSFYQCINIYRQIIEKPSINGFLLSCSMLALSKAKY